MKELFFLGDTLKRLHSFPDLVQKRAFQSLTFIQNGERAKDEKPMQSIGRGVSEIRVWNNDGTYRIIYTAKFENAVYVLHTFKKKTEKTSKSDIDLAKKRYSELLLMLRKNNGNTFS